MTVDPSRYFDHGAATPPSPRALDAQRAAALEYFGNPSAGHPAGRSARAELTRLKECFVDSLGSRGSRLVLASGATEANNQVIRSVLSEPGNPRVLIAIDAHASVWNAADPGSMDVLPILGNGAISLEKLSRAIGKRTRLVCLSHGSNETGAIHPVADAAALCASRGVRLLVDGSQALGRIPVDLSRIGCDYYTWSAHKFGGPRGLGGIILAGGRLEALMRGGSQEDGMRPGTENLPGLAGAWCALSECHDQLEVQSVRLAGLRGELLEILNRSGLAYEINGPAEGGLPGFLSLSWDGVDGVALVSDLGLRGFHVATGSACSADMPQASRVILALGRDERLARGTIRITLGPGNDVNGVAMLGRAIIESVGRLRRG